MVDFEGGKWGVIAMAITAAAAAFSVSLWWRESKRAASRIEHLESSLDSFSHEVKSERRGRIRAQQDLRKALLDQQRVSANGESKTCAFPFVPIAVVESCFDTRNGTPRQPLLVPLARACLVLNRSRVPLHTLEGLADFSHCWILFVFHLNTDLDKLWKYRGRTKKAKVRVPRLKGQKLGVLATRSPHRPCPIGLSVAKVEAVDGHTVLLSGVDLVDGTPVLDIKPYLPSDCIQEATLPKWLQGDNPLAVASVNFSSDFKSSLANCWETAVEHSLYASQDEFQTLIKQVLSWDIRSISQQRNPHHLIADIRNDIKNINDDSDDDHCYLNSRKNTVTYSPGDNTYHVDLEGFDVSYKIDVDSNITVVNVSLSPNFLTSRKGRRIGSAAWRSTLG